MPSVYDFLIGFGAIIILVLICMWDSGRVKKDAD